MLIAAISILSTGLLIYFVSLPLVYRKIPMNQLYGIRMPASFESHERWYDINAYGGRQMAAWSWLIVAVGISGFFLPDSALAVYTPAATVVILLALLIPVIRIIQYTRGLSPETSASQVSPMPSGEIVPAGRFLTKRILAPAIVLGCLCVAYVIFISESAQSLPPGVATHFGVSGRPNDWMLRESYLKIITVFGLAMAAFIVGLGLVIVLFAQPGPKSAGTGVSPGWTQNQSRFFGANLWFACFMLCFAAGIHYLVIEANRTHPPHMPSTGYAILIILINVVGILICFLSLKKPRG